MKSKHGAIWTSCDQWKVMTLACGYREWLHWVPLVVNQSLSLVKQWTSLTELCTQQRASEILWCAPESLIHTLVLPKSANPPKLLLGLSSLLIGCWLDYWWCHFHFVQYESKCIWMCLLFIDYMSDLFCHFRDPWVCIFEFPVCHIKIVNGRFMSVEHLLQQGIVGMLI